MPTALEESLAASRKLSAYHRGAARSSLESSLARSGGLSRRDATFSQTAGPYNMTVGGYGSSAGYANSGEGMFAAATANLGGLFAGYDDIAAAVRQYEAGMRDIPYTAFRPIAVKIADQPIHVGRKIDMTGRGMIQHKGGMAGAGRLSTKDQVAIEALKQISSAGIDLNSYTGGAFAKDFVNKLIHRVFSCDEFKQYLTLDSAPAFVRHACGFHNFHGHKALDSGGSATPDGFELVPDHKIIQAIENPNDHFTQWALMWCTIFSIMCTGRGFWWIDQNSETDEYADRTTLWYIPSSWVRPVHTRERAFDSWIVRPINTAAWMPIAREDMVYFYVPNPANPTTMFSPLQSWAKASSTDEEIQNAQYHAMRNIQRPGMILTAGRMDLPPGFSGQGPRPILTAEQRTQLINAIRLAYRGAIHTGDPLILDGLIESAEQMMSDPIDLDFPNGSKLTRMRILQGAGVNPIIMGEIEGANRASAYVAEEHFYTNVVNPYISLISQTMTKHFAPRYAAKGEKLYVWIENAKAHDQELTMKKLEFLAKFGWLEGNEARKFSDLSPLPDLDELPKMPPPGVKPGFFGGANVEYPDPAEEGDDDDNAVGSGGRSNTGAGSATKPGQATGRNSTSATRKRKPKAKRNGVRDGVTQGAGDDGGNDNPGRRARKDAKDLGAGGDYSGTIAGGIGSGQGQGTSGSGMLGDGTTGGTVDTQSNSGGRRRRRRNGNGNGVRRGDREAEPRHVDSGQPTPRDVEMAAGMP